MDVNTYTTEMGCSNMTWDELLARLFVAIQNGFADEYDLAGVRNWPDQDSVETPNDYFAGEWPAWASNYEWR